MKEQARWQSYLSKIERDAYHAELRRLLELQRREERREAIMRCREENAEALAKWRDELNAKLGITPTAPVPASVED